jgi:hypothetical protein
MTMPAPITAEAVTGTPASAASSSRVTIGMTTKA